MIPQFFLFAYMILFNDNSIFQVFSKSIIDFVTYALSVIHNMNLQMDRARFKLQRYQACVCVCMFCMYGKAI